jgi:thiamine pyrophosphokinase
MPCLLLTPEDVSFAVPPQIRLNLRAGDRLSLFPMMPVSGCSTGLRWPIDGIAFAPDGMIGTSNEVAEGPVQLRLDRPGMLAILPRGRLDAALTGLLGAVA